MVKKLEESIEGKVLTLLNFLPTRWSSFTQSLGRLIHNKDSLITYYHQKEPNNKKRAFLNNDYNIIMMELLHCLMDHFTEPIKLFQKDELSSVDVVQGLRKCLVTLQNISTIWKG
jgi:hypothetical protein